MAWALQVAEDWSPETRGGEFWSIKLRSISCATKIALGVREVREITVSRMEVRYKNRTRGLGLRGSTTSPELSEHSGGHRGSGEQFQRPGGTDRSGRRGERERDSWSTNRRLGGVDISIECQNSSPAFPLIYERGMWGKEIINQSHNCTTQILEINKILFWA